MNTNGACDYNDESGIDVDQQELVTSEIFEQNNETETHEEEENTNENLKSDDEITFVDCNELTNQTVETDLNQTYDPLNRKTAQNDSEVPKFNHQTEFTDRSSINRLSIQKISVSIAKE